LQPVSTQVDEIKNVRLKITEISASPILRALLFIVRKIMVISNFFLFLIMHGGLLETDGRESSWRVCLPFFVTIRDTDKTLVMNTERKVPWEEDLPFPTEGRDPFKKQHRHSRRKGDPLDTTRIVFSLALVMQHMEERQCG